MDSEGPMYDVIVIGVGGMGSATLFHLAASGCKVLGLEQFGIPHALGSSHGSTRIIRLAYSEGSDYVPLVRAAYRFWRELEDITGQRILHVTGGLDIGAADSRVVRGSRESCVRNALEFEVLDGGEVNRRFPGYRLDAATQAIHQPDGGYLRSEAAIAAYVEAATKRGADVLPNTQVLGWESSPGSIKVRTASEAYAAKRLVITAGAWITRLSQRLGHWCSPERQVMLWTIPSDPAAFQPSRFPVFTMETLEGLYYGFPDHDSEGFKIGKHHHRRERVDNPDELDRKIHEEDEAVIRNAVRRYFPRANGRTKRAVACMYTNTPDGHFILDHHPDEPRAFVAAGFSGHGFKFCSVVGKLMSQFCLNQQPTWEIDRFRLTDKRLHDWRLLLTR